MRIKTNWVQVTATLTALSLLAVISFGFQNCSEVGFESNDELVKAGIDGELRLLKLDPETIEDRPKINLTLITDNSSSMTPIQNQVADALSKVSGKLRGFDGEVQIYTTSQDGGAKRSAESDSYIEYLDNTDTIRLPAGSADQVPETSDYYEVTKQTISAPWSLSRQALSYSGTMTDSEFDAFKNQVSNSVRQLGVDGSDNERGLCTLLRALEAKSDQEAFEAFLLVSNEDDASTVASCLSETRKKVKSVRTESQPLEQCVGNEPNCQFSYKVTYQRKKKQVAEIKGRKISQKVFWSTDEITRNDRLDFNFWRHRAKVDYYEKRYSRYVTFTPYVLKDKLPVPASASQNHFFEKEVVGACTEEMSDVPVSCDSQAIPDSKQRYGLVEGSCYLTCKAVAPKKVSGPYGSWQGGKCPSGGIDYGQTNLENWLKNRDASYDLGNLDSYDSNCLQDSEEPKDFKLSAQPANCGANSCNTDQETQLLANIRGLGYGYIDTDDIDKCKVKCSQSNVGGNFNWNSDLPDICPDATESQNVTKKDLSCDSDMLDEALDRSGKASVDDISCKYQCKQEIKKSTITVDSDAVCSTTETCSPGESEYDLVADKLNDQHGLGLARIATDSCKILCQDGDSKGACNKTIEQSGLCSGGAPTGELAAQCPSDGFNVNSCSLESALKPGFQVEYSREAQPIETTSLLNDVEPKAAQVAEALNEKLNEGYFLASFVVPPGDETCEPESDYIDPANTYKALHDAIGDQNGRLYPICLSDYSPALDFSLDLIVRTVKQSYILDLDPNREFIWKLFVFYKDGSRELLDKSLYSLNQRLLTFSEEVDLSLVDDLQIEIVTENTE